MGDWAANKDLAVDGKVRAALSQWRSDSGEKATGQKAEPQPWTSGEQTLKFFRDLLGSITSDTTVETNVQEC